MKTLLIILAVLLTVHSRATAVESECLVVILKNGATLTVPVNEMPKITFDGTVMNIATESLQISNVSKYTFTSSSGTDIGSVESMRNAGVTMDGEKAYIRLPKPETDVRCYTVDGKELDVRKRNAGVNVISINLSEIDQQVFIISVGGESIKIRKP